MAEVRPKKKRSLDYKARRREVERQRTKTRIYIGDSFQRWRDLRQLKSFQTDAQLAHFLLDSYEQEVFFSTPYKAVTSMPSPPPLSSIGSRGSLSDREDFAIEGMCKMDSRTMSSMYIDDSETLSAIDILEARYAHGQEQRQGTTAVSQLEVSMSTVDLNETTVTADPICEDVINDLRNSTIDQEDTEYSSDEDFGEISYIEDDDLEGADSSDTDFDPDYVPRICIRTGGALEKAVNLDDLPEVNIEQTLYDLDTEEEGEEEQQLQPEDLEGETFTHAESVPVEMKVLCEDDIIGVPASIVYHNSLKQLVLHLSIPTKECKRMDRATRQKCGASKPFDVVIKQIGTAAVVEWVCPKGHIVWKWSSQPILKYGMHAGDFLLSSNIILSGNNYAKVALLFKFMNIRMVNEGTFYRIQEHFCFDTIREFWETKRMEVIRQLQSKPSVVALGDGRMDSPGFCAQYCSYSVMENDTKKIISIVNIDKRQTARNSVSMEKEGFLQAFESLHEDVNMTEFCTDASPQISALFNPKTGKLKDRGVKHSLDVWHGSKNLSRRITTAGQEKGCAVLLQWCRDICNHFWHCCKTTETYDEFFDMWVGLLHHVTGVHQWALGCCHHGPLEEPRAKELIEPNSLAHQKLRELILNARWLKDVSKFLTFRSTSDLESFHNHLLMYASKRQSFTYAGYSARIFLAGLDYNHHLTRAPRRKGDGDLQYAKLYSKRSRRWRLYTRKEKKDYSYILDLQAAILKERFAYEGMPRKAKSRPDDPRHLGTLSGVSAPSTEDLLRTQLSRGHSTASSPGHS